MRWRPRLSERVKERERAEKTLLNRSFQQTVVAALGQFAMVSNDISALLNQAVMLVAQTLEVEYCHVLELQPGGKFLLLRAGVGWKEGCVGKRGPSGRPANRVWVHAGCRRGGGLRAPGRRDPFPRLILAQPTTAS